MPNSTESIAKIIASREDNLEILENALALIEGRVPKSRRRISTRTIAIGALLVGLFFPPLIPLDEIIGTANAWRGPAVGVHELTLKTPSVRIGQPLIVNSKSEYFKACAWRWIHEWRRLDGTPIALSWLPGSAHAIGEITEHDFALELPRGIQPGNYLVHISGTGDCGHGDIAQVDHKNLAFTVID